MCLSAAVTCTARIIYVHADAPADFNTIQAAIDDSNDGDTVIVADGIYTGHGNRDIDFLDKAITLRSENGPENCIIDCEGARRGFYFHSGEDANSVLSGFTITNGYACCVYEEARGGGVYCNASSPTIDNCIFNQNLAEWSGGGMTIRGGSSPTIINCVFSGNSASGGGGLSTYSSNPKLTNCTFSGNSANAGGGMANYSYSTPSLTNCVFSGNSANDSGGGMHNYRNSPTLTNCTLSRNSVGWRGGGMSNINSSATIANCVFNENSADYGGGMDNDEGTALTIINCILSGNLARHCGGGMRNWRESSAMLTNCTVSDNRANEKGGGIYCSGADAEVNNCILWSDIAPMGNEIALVQYIVCGSFGCDYYPSSIIVSYSDIQFGSADVYIDSNCTLNWSDGNIDADPYFVSGTIGDYFLSQIAAGQKSNSPCVDAGIDLAAYLGMDSLTTRTDKATDIGIVDMGYHHSLYPEIGDFSNDWMVNFIDFAIFAKAWRSQLNGPNWNQLCDISEPKDKVINERDLAVFTKYWLEQNILYEQ